MKPVIQLWNPISIWNNTFSARSTNPIILSLVCFWIVQVFRLQWNLVQADFICDFEQNNTCGYESQDNLLHFTTISEFPTITGFGFAALDLSKVNLTVAPGARLMSKYYPTYANDACLLIKFLCWGPGIDRWTLIMRNSHNDQRLYEYENDWNPTMPSNNLDQYWITMTVPVDLTTGQVMFFIELLTKGHSPNGLFLVDHIAFLYLKCPFKQVKHFPSAFMTRDNNDDDNHESCSKKESNNESKKESKNESRNETIVKL